MHVQVLTIVPRRQVIVGIHKSNHPYDRRRHKNIQKPFPPDIERNTVEQAIIIIDHNQAVDHKQIDEHQIVDRLPRIVITGVWIKTA